MSAPEKSEVFPYVINCVVKFELLLCCGESGEEVLGFVVDYDVRSEGFAEFDVAR